MKTFYGSKFDYIKSLHFGENKNYLDLGCRDNILKTYLPQKINYTGVDLFQNDHNGVDIISNVEESIPVEDNSFDYIFMLDILEHLNDFQGVLENALKKLKIGGELYINLPNLSYFKYRIDYLLNGKFTVTGKYKLTYNGSIDRHRWLTNFDDVFFFFNEFISHNGFCFDITLLTTRKLRILKPFINNLNFNAVLFRDVVIKIIK
jgi:SAM-dependent methyltransferase